jgi:hypothetical protein
MLARTGMFLAPYPIDAIFLVTEERRILMPIAPLFAVWYCIPPRSEPMISRPYHIRPYPRPLRMYRLGLDTLKDTMLLARVDYLLAGGANGLAVGSNVSLMAQIWNAGTYKLLNLSIMVLILLRTNLHCCQANS